MIESRYKIEYVLPDDDVKKTSPFKVLWYLLLIPLMMLIVTAITYDFSIKDFSRDTSALIGKAKVYVFNLGDVTQLNSVAKQKENVRKELNLKNTINTTTTKTTEETNKAETKIENKDKTTIVELTAAQEKQLKTIKRQVSRNTQLTLNLNKLSEQLVLEKNKNESLNNRIAEQEKDRLELEEQLYNISEKSEIGDNSIDELDISKDKVISLDIPKTTETNIVSLPKKTEVSPVEKSKVLNEKSETDKIIEAMSTVETQIKTEPNIALKETVSADKKQENPKTQNKKIDNIVKKPLTIAINQDKVTDPASEKKPAVSVPVKQEKPDQGLILSKPKELSSVDAIIAEMQGVKSDIKDDELTNNKKAE